MKAEATITFGIEIDVDEARSYAEQLLGEEYDEDMTDEECVEIYGSEKFSHGLGCDVTVTRFVR